MSVILKSRCLVACLFWLVTVTQSIPAMPGCLHKHFLKQALQSLRWTQSRWRVKQEEMKWFSARGWALISWEALSNQTDERWEKRVQLQDWGLLWSRTAGECVLRLLLWLSKVVSPIKLIWTPPSASRLAQHPLQTLKILYFLWKCHTAEVKCPLCWI